MEPRHNPTLIMHILYMIKGETFNLRALIDTWAEVNVIRKGILP